MRYIKLFENFKGGNIRFFDKNGRWFSSGTGLSSIDKHKETYGDDITFSVDGTEKVFLTKDEYLEFIKSKDSQVSSIFGSEEAKKRLELKRNLTK